MVYSIPTLEMHKTYTKAGAIVNSLKVELKMYRALKSFQWVFDQPSSFTYHYANCLLVSVLTRVGILVVQHLENIPTSGRDKRAQEWTNPVDPVVTWEVSSSDSSTQ